MSVFKPSYNLENRQCLCGHRIHNKETKACEYPMCKCKKKVHYKRGTQYKYESN